MSGIICCARSISAISALLFDLKWCQKERKKNQVKKGSQRSRGQWWVLLQGLPQLCHLRHHKAQRRKAMKVIVLGVWKLRNMDRTVQPVVGRDTSHEPVDLDKQFVGSSYSARYSGWDDDKAWSSQEWKADELMDDRTETPVCRLLGKDTWVPIKFLSCEDQKKLVVERWHPLSAFIEEQGHSNSSLETTKQKWNCP